MLCNIIENHFYYNLQPCTDKVSGVYHSAVSSTVKYSDDLLLKNYPLSNLNESSDDQIPTGLNLLDISPQCYRLPFPSHTQTLLPLL
jgi:hypothetical protein